MITGIPAVLAGAGLLLLFMLLGMPVFVAFMLVNLIAVFVLLGPAGFGMLASSFYDTTTSGSLVTIPLFILMGEILFRSHAVDVLFRSMDELIGHIRGRQYVLSIALATIFSTLSGAAMGVAAMLGRSLLPGMIARGYDPKLSAGNILAGASLAPLVPPSVLVIIIGTLASVSIAGLLVAGILPGLMFAGLFLGYTFIRIRFNPKLTPEFETIDREVTARDKVMAVVRMLPFSIIIISVMGFILMGIATPNEAGAMGVVGALVAAAIYRRLNYRMVADSLGSAAMISAMILIIMASSKLFSQLLAFTGGASALTEWVAAMEYAPWIMLIILMALPFVLCMFIDQIALMLIIIPIYKPIIEILGFDPLWFWLLFLVNITVGGMTPPFGYTLFALKSAWTEGTLVQVYGAAWPFVLLFVFGMVLLAIFPVLATYLPSLL
ncbi:TRAP transporter large permease subunit [Marinobacter sp. TBZ242]|uniref:TRAP transporter large permease protein n=1 Tax=Marinobacter azerbaijanicus TaxID=3050455 RepID=A0ABT7IGC2_9GAMM|nr:MULTISPECIES: TRAP transporter large permease subunit [Marinobacter]MBJ7275768.1 TRAP transporter large permease subunit [Marinobacter salarius]MBL3557859.1 TRAP transporter large permease subunit [Marinobacter sp. JB05H06]MDL0433211.1 TRAP transporter large permease subunit [Marinobacter sp. TBZ242]